jgi:hypothetical protein
LFGFDIVYQPTADNSVAGVIKDKKTNADLELTEANFLGWAAVPLFYRFVQ